MAPNKPAEKERAGKIPLRITDTTLRDAHQSLWATRMRIHDIMEIIDIIDSVGYYSLEVWGGATFDVCLRVLRENPWERLRMIKSRAKKTPLQMLLRGQNILGYKNYADYVLERQMAMNTTGVYKLLDDLYEASFNVAKQEKKELQEFAKMSGFDAMGLELLQRKIEG